MPLNLKIPDWLIALGGDMAMGYILYWHEKKLRDREEHAKADEVVKELKNPRQHAGYALAKGLDAKVDRVAFYLTLRAVNAQKRSDQPNAVGVIQELVDLFDEMERDNNLLIFKKNDGEEVIKRETWVIEKLQMIPEDSRTVEYQNLSRDLAGDTNEPDLQRRKNGGREIFVAKLSILDADDWWQYRNLIMAVITKKLRYAGQTAGRAIDKLSDFIEKRVETFTGDGEVTDLKTRLTEVRERLQDEIARLEELERPLFGHRHVHSHFRVPTINMGRRNVRWNFRVPTINLGHRNVHWQFRIPTFGIVRAIRGGWQ